jgi:two-component system cell cycle response regulator DivK
MTRILYIDDDMPNRLLVRRILNASGFIVEDVSNAAEGIRIAQENPPDLILMDMSMPEMDGLTATAKIRTMSDIGQIPIVAVTANVMQGDRQRTLDAGCDGYIGKPIDVDTFVDQISQYLKLESADGNQQSTGNG